MFSLYQNKAKKTNLTLHQAWNTSDTEHNNIGTEMFSFLPKSQAHCSLMEDVKNNPFDFPPKEHFLFNCSAWYEMQWTQ